MATWTRVPVRVVLVTLLAVAMSGCIYDGPLPRASLTNRSDRDVTLEVVDPDHSYPVPAGTKVDLGEEPCFGEQMRVVAEDGQVLAVLEGSLCPTTELTVRRDGTVELAPT